MALKILLLTGMLFSISVQSDTCKDSSQNLKNQAKQIYCQQFQNERCEDFFATLDPYLTAQLAPKNCLKKDSELNQLIATANIKNEASGSAGIGSLLVCSPVAIAMVHKMFGNFMPTSYFFGSDYIRKILKSSRFQMVGSANAIAAFIMTSYIFMDLLIDAIKNEKNCQDPIKNFELMRSLAEADTELRQQLRTLLPEAKLEQIAFPEIYQQENFIKNLTCQKIKDIVFSQKRKYDSTLGPLLAQNKLKSDPRLSKQDNFSEEEQKAIKSIHENWSCLNGEALLKFSCLIANLVIGGRSITQIYQSTKKGLEASVIQAERIKKFIASRPISPLFPVGFKPKEMAPQYIGEEIQKPFAGASPPVSYFSASEKMGHAVTFEKGQVRFLDSELGSTLQVKSAWKKDGPAIFVIDKNGNFLISNEHVAGKIHHSSLDKGQPVLMAGEIEIKDGYIIAVNNRSGHYEPTNDHMEFFKNYLKINGIDISKIQFSTLLPKN